jgi:lipoate-protein ligase A
LQIRNLQFLVGFVLRTTPLNLCRFLPFSVADGPHNMAADQILLEAAQGGIASLRFYGWTEATVSLGYFQPHRIRQTDPRVAALPFVRRPSGGAALVHHHEVTYALGLPAGSPWQTGESWLCCMHTILSQALADLGVPVSSCNLLTPAHFHFSGLLCFQHITPGDLVVATAKVTGSAQRRQRGALLQHGAVLLASSPFSPALPGIRELTGQSLAALELCPVMARRFAHTTGWNLHSAPWQAQVQDRIQTLVSTRYSQKGWNEKR